MNHSVDISGNDHIAHIDFTCHLAIRPRAGYIFHSLSSSNSSLSLISSFANPRAHGAFLRVLHAIIIPQPCPFIIRTHTRHSLLIDHSPPHRINLSRTRRALFFVPSSISVHATLPDTICQRRALFVEFEVCGYVVCSVGTPSSHTLSLGLTYFICELCFLAAR